LNSDHPTIALLINRCEIVLKGFEYSQYKVVARKLNLEHLTQREHYFKTLTVETHTLTTHYY